MKMRDYVAVTLIVLVLMWAFKPTGPAGSVKERPFMAGVVKLAKQLGWILLLTDEPPHDDPAPEPYMTLPQELVNERPTRTPDADGIVHLDHSGGW